MKTRARRSTRTGAVLERRPGVFDARITLQDGSKAQLRCDPGITRKKAKADALKWQREEDETHKLYIAKLRKAGVIVDGETADDWFERMLPLRTIARRVKDEDDLRSTWRTWISPIVGPVPIAGITPEHCRKVRDALDDARATDRISGKTAANIWSAFRRSLTIATSTKGWAKALKCLDKDPSAGIEPPDGGRARKRQWIYPVEFAQLVASPTVPRERRVAYAVAAYSGLRPAELGALKWRDVDFVAGVLRINGALDRKTKEVDTTKTETGVRLVPIERSLLPLLQAIRGDDAEWVVPFLHTGDGGRHRVAATFREDLRIAGLDAERLFTKTATHLPADFRCLRDTYATWHCLAGLDVHKLMRRMGHASMTTTMQYAKAAEVTDRQVGTPFGSLVEVTLEVTSRIKPLQNMVEAPGIEPVLRGRGRPKKRVFVKSWHDGEQSETLENPENIEVTSKVTSTNSDGQRERDNAVGLPRWHEPGAEMWVH